LLGLSISLVDETGKPLQEGSARLLMRKTRHEKATWGSV